MDRKQLHEERKDKIKKKQKYVAKEDGGAKVTKDARKNSTKIIKR
jgi:hypothetical protein